MKKIITIKWEIHDSRNANGGYRTGISKIKVCVKSYMEVVNMAISFADSIPDWELEKNNIDVEEYRDYPYCSYHYVTKLSKILKIENVK